MCSTIWATYRSQQEILIYDWLELDCKWLQAYFYVETPFKSHVISIIKHFSQVFYSFMRSLTFSTSEAATSTVARAGLRILEANDISHMLKTLDNNSQRGYAKHKPK